MVQLNGLDDVCQSTGCFLSSDSILNWKFGNFLFKKSGDMLDIHSLSVFHSIQMIDMRPSSNNLFFFRKRLNDMKLKLTKEYLV